MVGICRIDVLTAACEKNVALAIREEGGTQILGCNTNDVGMLTQSPVVKLGEIPDAVLRVCADRGGPENTVLAEVQFAILGFCEKPLDILVRDARKEENLVKITLPRQFGLPFREARVLDQFAEGEGTQRHNRDSSVRRESFEGLRGCRQGGRHGNTGEASEADGGCLLRF